MYSTSELDELFRILNSIKGFKLNNHKGATQQNDSIPRTGIKSRHSGKWYFTDYYEKLKKNLKYMGERLQKFRSQRLDMLNRNRQYHAFEIGQIVYLYQPRASVVQTGSRKVVCFCVGPLVIFKAVGPNQFLLMSLDGQIYPHLIEETRLEPGTIWTSKGNVTTLVELRQALSTGLKIQAKQNSTFLVMLRVLLNSLEYKSIEYGV